MSEKKRPSWRGWLFRGLWLVFWLLMLGNSWNSFRRLSPDGGLADYARQFLQNIIWAWPFFALLAVLLIINHQLGRMQPERLRGYLPLMITGLCLSVAAAGVLIWMQSGWAALALGLAIFLGVQAARAAGLEPPNDPAAPHNQGH